MMPAATMARSFMTRQTIVLILALAMLGCQKQRRDSGAQMMLDAGVSGPNARTVAPKTRSAPDEPIGDFGALRNIAQTDIDALQQVQAKGVVYVRKGQSVRPAEVRQ
jgi:hypothetical protein